MGFSKSDPIRVTLFRAFPHGPEPPAVLSYFSDRDLVFILLYLSFYLTGYSPDRWYERKNAKA